MPRRWMRLSWGTLLVAVTIVALLTALQVKRARTRNRAIEQFATEGIPRTYLISRDGTILYQSVGFYEEFYEQELARLKRLVREQVKTLP